MFFNNGHDLPLADGESEAERVSKTLKRDVSRRFLLDSNHIYEGSEPGEEPPDFELTGHSQTVTGLAFLPEHKLIASCSQVGLMMAVKHGCQCICRCSACFACCWAVDPSHWAYKHLRFHQDINHSPPLQSLLVVVVGAPEKQGSRLLSMLRAHQHGQAPCLRCWCVVPPCSAGLHSAALASTFHPFSACWSVQETELASQPRRSQCA